MSLSVRPGATTAAHRPAAHHFAPKVKGAGYFPGVGVPMQNQPKPGFYIDLAPLNPSAKVTAKVKVDEAKRVITFTVDASVKHLTLPRDQARHVELSGRPQHLGQYKVVVQTPQGKVLYRGTTKNYLPM
jgi:hypothetical protein